VANTIGDWRVLIPGGSCSVACCCAAVNTTRQSGTPAWPGAGQSPSTQQITVNHEEIPGFHGGHGHGLSCSGPTRFYRGATPATGYCRSRRYRGMASFWLDHVAVTDKSGRAAATANPPLHELMTGESCAGCAIHQSGCEADPPEPILRAKRCCSRSSIHVVPFPIIALS